MSRRASMTHVWGELAQGKGKSLKEKCDWLDTGGELGSTLKDGNGMAMVFYCWESSLLSVKG